MQSYFVCGLLSVSLLAAAAHAWSQPEYVLILRHCAISGTVLAPGIVSHVEGKEPSGEPEANIGSDFILCTWHYLTETYESLDEVLVRLNSRVWDEDQVVGLWHIGKKVELKLEVTERVEPVRTEERKWTEHKWQIKR